MTGESKETARLKYDLLIGTGGIGTGIFFQLEGNRTLGRNESRPGVLLDVRDFCKLHIICHYAAVLLGAGQGGGSRFRVVPVGRVGGDDAGGKLAGMMKQTGMDTGWVQTEPDAATLFSVCFQYPDSSGGNITAADSASSRVSPADIQRAEELFGQYRGSGIALAAPEVPLEARLELLRTASRYGFLRFCTLNSDELSQPAAAEILRYTDIFCLNRDEAETLTGERLADQDTAGFLGLVWQKCLEANPGLKVCLTLGADGSYGYEQGSWEFTPCARVEPRSTAGAGDATVSGLICGMAWGLPFILPARPCRRELGEAPLETAMDFAALLASFSVESADTINLRAGSGTLRGHADKLGIILSGPVARGLAAAG